MKPETQTKLIIYGYVITIFCLLVVAFCGPIYYVIIKQEETIKQEIKAWEQYKAQNECRKIGTIYPNQVRYECADGYIYTRTE